MVAHTDKIEGEIPYENVYYQKISAKIKLGIMYFFVKGIDAYLFDNFFTWIFFF